MSNPWFRMYSEAVDDEKLRLIAFEDRWHFVAILCLKCQGVLDAGDDQKMLQRKVAVKLGLQLRELEAVELRLQEVGLIGEGFQPIAWDNRQYKSDTSAERTRAYRERMKRHRDVTVTAQETDTDTDTETEKNKKAFVPPIDGTLLAAWKQVRKAKRAGPITEIAWKAIERESVKAGISTEDAVRICVERGWQSFNADWIAGKVSAGKQDKRSEFNDFIYGRNRSVRTERDITDEVNSAALPAV